MKLLSATTLALAALATGRQPYASLLGFLLEQTTNDMTSDYQVSLLPQFLPVPGIPKALTLPNVKSPAMAQDVITGI